MPRFSRAAFARETRRSGSHQPLRRFPLCGKDRQRRIGARVAVAGESNLPATETLPAGSRTEGRPVERTFEILGRAENPGCLTLSKGHRHHRSESPNPNWSHAAAPVYLQSPAHSDAKLPDGRPVLNLKANRK